MDQSVQKPSKFQFCDSCKERIEKYHEALLDIDLRLQLMADLAISTSSHIDSNDTIAGLGSEVNEALNRYKITRNYFFGVDSHGCNDEVLVKSEIIRIKGRVENSSQGVPDQPEEHEDE